MAVTGGRGQLSHAHSTHGVQMQDNTGASTFFSDMFSIVAVQKKTQQAATQHTHTADHHTKKEKCASTWFCFFYKTQHLPARGDESDRLARGLCDDARRLTSESSVEIHIAMKGSQERFRVFVSLRVCAALSFHTRTHTQRLLLGHACISSRHR